MNQKLDSMMTSIALSQVDGIVGRTIISADGSVPARLWHPQSSPAALSPCCEDGQEVPLGRRHHDDSAMNQADALDIVQSALWTVIVASGPAIGAAMAIGIVIALLQALTQVQEMTLTFIPKIIAILVICSLTAPFMGAVIYSFAEQVYARIEVGF